MTMLSLQREEIAWTYKKVTKMSMEIRKQYHALERQLHKQEWTTEEDALAFLTDAGLVRRQVMAKEGRWPSINEDILPAKIGDCVRVGRLGRKEAASIFRSVEDFLKTRLEICRKFKKRLYEKYELMESCPHGFIALIFTREVCAD